MPRSQNLRFNSLNEFQFIKKFPNLFFDLALSDRTMKHVLGVGVWPYSQPCFQAYLLPSSWLLAPLQLLPNSHCCHPPPVRARAQAQAHTLHALNCTVGACSICEGLYSLSCAQRSKTLKRK